MRVDLETIPGKRGGWRWATFCQATGRCLVIDSFEFPTPGLAQMDGVHQHEVWMRDKAKVYSDGFGDSLRRARARRVR